MAFEDIKAEIALFFEEMLNKLQDVHEIETVLRGKLDVLKVENMPLPKNLIELEKRLSKDFNS